MPCRSDGLAKMLEKRWERVFNEMLRRLKWAQETGIARLLAEAIEEGVRGLCRVSRCTVAMVEARLLYRGAWGRGEPQPWAWFGVHIHPIYNIPVIPASSIKGAMRSFYAKTLTAALRCPRGERDSCIEACISTLFGGTGEEEHFTTGLSPIIVTDAYPLQPGIEGMVAPDVQTPHYQRGEKPVGDEESAKPRPLRGYSAGLGTRYRFYVILDEDRLEAYTGQTRRKHRAATRHPLQACITSIVGAPDTKRLLAYLVTGALEREGIGGKTTRGYGILRVENLTVTRTKRRAA